MQTRTKTTFYTGFTLVELVLAIGLVAIVGTATVGLIRNSSEDMLFGSRRSNLMQEGYSALSMMVRTLRQVHSIVSVTDAANPEGMIEFVDANGVIQQFQQQAGNKALYYGDPNSMDLLMSNITSLSVTCYDRIGQLLGAPIPTLQIKTIQLEATFVDDTDPTIAYTLSDRVFWSKSGVPDVVINEMMYNPIGYPERSKEWVEIYNKQGFSEDVTGWEIGTANDQGILSQIISWILSLFGITLDPISSRSELLIHPILGDAPMTLESHAYALVVPSESSLLEERCENGGFESWNLNDWDTVTNWSRTSWNAHSGLRKLESSVNGASELMQEITLPSTWDRMVVGFWEYTTALPEVTSLTATIQNTSDQVLETVYSGEFASEWTFHSLDISDYIGQTIQLHFEANKVGLADVLLLDDVFVTGTDIPEDVLLLTVDDDEIGNGLSNLSDAVSLSDGIATVDIVSYESSWGGSGNGTSLSRISVSGLSSDESNWESGPLDGTPGTAN